MRLDQAIAVYLGHTLNAVLSAGRISVKRMVLSGEHSESYLAGFNDALSMTAAALGVDLQLGEPGPAPLPPPATRTIDAPVPAALPASSTIVTSAPAASTLTFRELEVARMIADGATSSRISLQLATGVATVNKHRFNIHGKLGFSDPVNVAAWLKTQPPAKPDAAPPKFTKTEEKIARLILTGASNAEIAAVMISGDATIRSHLQHMHAKTGSRSHDELTAWLKVNLPTDSAPTNGVQAKLSGTEYTIAVLAARGSDDAQIADTLDLQLPIVRSFVACVLAKTGAPDRKALLPWLDENHPV